MTHCSKWPAALFAGAFFLLVLIGMKTAHTPIWRLTGIIGWVLVAAGFFSVAVTVWWSARPRRQRILVRAQVAGQAPEKIEHSAQYIPPPHRWQYTSVQRRR
ncbi:MAG: hypothetical protein HFE94_03685 [Acutalibacter sp.]|nr:hypothetical protein [Acutalibacter sp.]